MKFGRGIVNENDMLKIIDYVKGTPAMQSMPVFVREELAVEHTKEHTYYLQLAYQSLCHEPCLHGTKPGRGFCLCNAVRSAV